MKCHERAAEFLNLPPVKWAETFEALTVDEQEDLHRGLTGLVQSATLAWKYVDARDAGLAHDAAVKVAQDLMTKVRKDMGFSYPDSARFSF